MKTNTEESLSTLVDGYNELPYKSFPFPFTLPTHLSALANLVGIATASVEKARILELGCASGGNILPIAAQYPTAEIIGVDISPIHIEQGLAFIENAGLKNITLIQASITDLDASIGQFDFIIVHGVFSWVTDDVREKIWRICSKQLASQGIAYISFNTLPGWNTLGTIREMARYHATTFDTLKEKIEQSKLLLDFVNDAVKGYDNSHTRLIAEAADLLKTKEDYYIAHEFLNPLNKAFYFSEFMDQAKQHGLQYLADASISTMFLENYPESVRESLGQIQDVVRTEQYLDFINNRSFRASLLCHQDLTITRNLNPGMIRQFYIRTQLKSLIPLHELDIDNDTDKVEFFIDSSSKKTISTTSSILKAVFCGCAWRFNQYRSFQDIVSEASSKLPKKSEVEIENETALSLLKLVLSGHARITTQPPAVNHTITSQPKAWAYAVTQSMEPNQFVVTNLFHESVTLNHFEKVLLRYLDGQSSKDEILQRVLVHVNNNEFDVNYLNQKVSSEERILNILSLAYLDALEKFAAGALLV